MSVRGVMEWNTADQSDGACRGICLSAEQRSEIWQTDWTGHAEGCTCLSEERQSEIRQTNWMGHAEGHTCLSEEGHAENAGAHHLNFLLLNHFSSNFVFVITYQAARQIIERPCYLLSHAVHNSKLTTLPQSQGRWQPRRQRILEARQIIERLAKDPVTLFHSMTWFILGHAWAQWNITCHFVPCARRETLPFLYVP